MLRGSCQTEGVGAEKNEEIGFKLFLQAADKEHPIALYNAGLGYYYGRGVTTDKNKGITLIQLSSELGVEDAKQFLREIGFPNTRP